MQKGQVDREPGVSALRSRFWCSIRVQNTNSIGDGKAAENDPEQVALSASADYL